MKSKQAQAETTSGEQTLPTPSQQITITCFLKDSLPHKATPISLSIVRDASSTCDIARILSRML